MTPKGPTLTEEDEANAIFDLIEAAPEFSNQELAALAGVSPANIQNWVNRGLLHLGLRSPGKGHHRQFDWALVHVTATVVRLSRLGFSTGQAWAGAYTAITRFSEVLRRSVNRDEDNGELVNARELLAIIPAGDADGMMVVRRAELAERLSGLLSNAPDGAFVVMALGQILTDVSVRALELAAARPKPARSRRSAAA